MREYKYKILVAAMSINWTEIISSGIKQLESDLEACFATCEEWVEEDWRKDFVEKDADCYFDRGMFSKQQHQYSEAIVQFTKAIALNPDLTEAHLERGISFHKLGDLSNAIADLNRALELNPEQIKAYYYRGTAHAYLGNYQLAIEDFSKLIEINATANKYYNRGVIYYQTEEYEKAIADLTRVIAVEPEFTAAYYALGNSHYGLSNQEEAQKSYQLAESIKTNLNPNDEHGYYMKAIAAKNQGQSARKYFSQAAIACKKSYNLKLGLEIALLMNDKELI